MQASIVWFTSRVFLCSWDVSAGVGLKLLGYQVLYAARLLGTRL
jgi:hypothetical protein